MSSPIKRPNFGRRKAPRPNKNLFTTKSGNKIALNRNMRTKRAISKDARARSKAAYLATLPKGRVKRTLYRMHPKRMAAYWFSREGGIMALKITGIGILAAFLLLVGVFAYFRKDLPNLRGITGNNIGGSIRYYDKTGKVLLWEDYDAVKRIPVKEDDVSQVMKDATIAIEDKDFFQHGGFDVRGITRAGFNNITGGGGGTQGGSTITQQVVKLNQNWTQERTYTRKVKELILAVELERTYSKKEILTGYLNSAPYGDITYGVEAAMQDYFQKPAKNITLDEAAFLAAMPKSPTYFSPYGSLYDKEALLARQDYVLDLMAEQGKITPEQRDEAKKVNTLKKIKPRKSKYLGIKAPWFVLAAKEEVQERCKETVNCGGWKVTTTLDMKLQKLAEEQVANGMQQVQYQGGDVAAFAAEDVKTGQVVALVGGTDFNNKEYGQNNYARTKLPPGSSFKPYDYLSVIENTTDFGAGTVLYDSQDPIDGYPCTNKARPPAGNCLYDYDFRYPGPMTLRYALGGSRNVPAVKSMLIAGIDKTIETANKIGLRDKGNVGGVERQGHGYKCYSDDELTKEAQCYGSSAIGDGAYLKLDEHVHGFASISRNGKVLPQTYILQIEDATNKPFYKWEPSEGKQAVRDEAAYIVADMIEDPNASYLGSKGHRYNGWKFGFKTGTTNDSKDGWMMSESPRYAAGVWVGYHNRQRELSGFMENMTQPIVQGWMQKAHDGLQPEERPKPKGIQTLPAYVVRTHVGVGSVEPSPTNDLYPSWYKKQRAGSNQTIDRVSNKLATNCTPERAKQSGANAVANEFSSDTYHGARLGSGTSEKDDVHKCDDAKPAVLLSGPDTCSGNGYFTATIRRGTHPLSSDKFRGTVNFIVGGETVRSVNISGDSSVKFSCSSVSKNGRQSIKVEVIDSVLYDGSASKTTNFPTPVSVPKITSAVSGGTVSWSGGQGTGTVYNADDNSVLCSGSGSCTLPSGIGGQSIYVKSGGKKSTTAVVTGT